MKKSLNRGLQICLMLGLCSLGFINCRSSASDSPGPGGGGQTPVGTIKPEIKQVVGSFFLGTQTRPAVNYQVWLLDQTEGGYNAKTLGEDGRFEFALGEFTEEHTYSLHLIDPTFREIGVLDLSTLNSGTQAAFVYKGGYGFDLGAIVVTLSDLGEVNFDAPGLKAKVGGGFTLQPEADVNFLSAPLPKGIAKFTFDSQLIADDVNVVLRSFYLREINPDAYSRDLGLYSAITSVITAEDEGGLSAVFVDDVLDAGSWLNGARLAKASNIQPSKATPWSKSNYHWSKSGEFGFQATLFTGRLLAQNSVIVATVRPQTKAQHRIPRKLKRVIGMIPMVQSIALSGSPLSEIDYADADASNGLTRPFCLDSGDVTLGISPPQDLEGTAIALDQLSQVTFAFDYFSTSDGLDQALSARVSDFPTAFQSDQSDALASGADRTWQAANKLVVIEPTTDVAADELHEVILWKEVFLENAAGKTVNKIRVRLYFKTPDSSLISGTVLWFTRDC